MSTAINPISMLLAYPNNTFQRTAFKLMVKEEEVILGSVIDFSHLQTLQCCKWKFGCATYAWGKPTEITK